MFKSPYLLHPISIVFVFSIRFSTHASFLLVCCHIHNFLFRNNRGQKEVGWHIQSAERRKLSIKNSIHNKTIFQKYIQNKAIFREMNTYALLLTHLLYRKSQRKYFKLKGNNSG